LAAFTLMGTLIDIGRRTLARFVELDGFDRAMALAGQAFAALLPLLIVIGSIAPAQDDGLAAVLIDRFNVSGDAADALQAAVAQPPHSGISAAGAVLLVISALSFTRAMQRLYLRAWRLDKLGLRANYWGLVWLAMFGAFWSAQPAIVGLFDGVLAFGIALALSTTLWVLTPWLLTARRIAWRRLLPQALLTSVGLLALAIGGAIYLPRAIATASEEFGVLGVGFALLSLLFSIALVLVVTAALGATLGESPRAGDAERDRADDDGPVTSFKRRSSA
jgi:membrane protein